MITSILFYSTHLLKKKKDKLASVKTLKQVEVNRKLLSIMFVCGVVGVVCRFSISLAAGSSEV